MKKSFIICTATLLLVLVSCADTKKQKEKEWEYLFNGKDLTGWVQLGGNARYEVVDNTIVGTSVLGTPNSFLTSDKNYSDFILELDFKVDPSLNSGIQIRSHSLPEYRDGRVHGYQFEIDPSKRAWSGGIFDESRRGWLYPLNEPENEDARNAFKNGEWNKVRVEAIGNTIKTWLNDIPAANLVDDQTAEGFIALQVHGINKPEQEGTQVAWRNIRIITENVEKYATETTAPEKSYLLNKLTDYEQSQGWKLIFDGKSSQGWRSEKNDTFPETGWKIENGILTVEAVRGPGAKKPGSILTVDQYSDFELKLEVRLTEGANSGIKYHYIPNVGGPEYQILDDKVHPDAKLGKVEGSRTFASLYDLIKAENKRVNEIGQWNTIRIISKGKHVEHWLNGFKVLEYNRDSDEFRNLVAQSKFSGIQGYGETDKGFIQLQEHNDEVSFRNIKIREL